MVRIDPKNKCFMAIFWIVIVGVIGFFIASIFIKFSSNDEEGTDSVVEIKFRSSRAVVKLKSYVPDNDDVDDDNKQERYLLEVYNGE